MKEASFNGQGNALAGILSRKNCSAPVSAMSLLGACLLLLTTRWGIGLYSDSIVYIGAARSILQGTGFRFIDDIGQFAPVIQYPPLYSYLIAAFAVTGIDAVEAARWISILFFAANIGLIAHIAYRCTGSYGASLVAAFFALTAFPLIYIHSLALTEPIFIFMIFLAFSLLARYLQDPRLWIVNTASLIVGLSCLVRYVGVAFVATGALVILCSGRAKWKEKLAHATLFGIVASFPFVAWAARNLWLAGSAVNRTLGFHPPAFRDLLPTTDTMGYWLFPSDIVDTLPWISRSGLAIVVVFFCWLVARAGFPRSPYIKSLGFCVAGYFIFLLVSFSLNDQPLYFDTRTMALPYVALMILAVSIVVAWFRANRPAAKSWRWFALDCVLIVLGLTQMINGVVWLRHSYLEGLGLAVERWRDSELLNLVKNGQTPNLIFSNAPDFIYTLTGKRAVLIPRKVTPDKTLKNSVPNQQYAAEVANMKEQLEKSQGLLIYFDDADDRLWYLPSKKELETKLPLQVLKTASDGTVYGIDGLAKVSKSLNHIRHAR